MSTALTKAQAEALLNILIRQTQHRAGKPFSGEFISHVTNPATSQRKYWFLNENYHQFNVLPANGAFTVEAVSEDSKVLASAQRANDEIARIFNRNMTAA